MERAKKKKKKKRVSQDFWVDRATFKPSNAKKAQTTKKKEKGDLEIRCEAKEGATAKRPLRICAETQ